MNEIHQNTQELLAGAIKRPITPTVRGRRVFMAGYDSGQLATEIHDELWVRAVALRRRDVTLILVGLDLLGLFRQDVELIREQAAEEGVPTEGLIVTCTHNHAGPDTLGLWGKGAFGSGLNLRYMDFLRREVVRVILLAVRAMEPAQAYLARSSVAGLVSDGEGDELCVLQLRTHAGKMLATVVNYPLVPMVLDNANRSISADFPNWLYSDLEQSRNEVALYICADASEQAQPVVRERTWNEAERVGHELAAAVRAALDGVPPTVIDRIDVRKKPLSIPPDVPLVKWFGRVGSLGQHILTDWRTDSEVGLIQLGPARLAVLPGLVSPELGFEIRKMLDAPYRWLLCMSNDSLGFITLQESALTSAGSRVSLGPARRGILVGSQAGTIVLDQMDRLMLEMLDAQK